jgi:uncharacterized protein (DUF2147 family)
MQLRSFATVLPFLFAQTAFAQSTPAQSTSARPTSARPTSDQAVPAYAGTGQVDTFDAAPKADALLGEWWTEGKEGRVKIVKTASGLYEVVLLDGKDVDKKDEENPNEKLRERKLRGIVLMWNLRFDGEEYVDGYCYNPRDGETYRVKMKLTGPTTLKLRGYLAVPLFGQTQDWTRAN